MMQLSRSLFRLLFFLICGLTTADSYAQMKDSITWNSTCANYKVQFGSSYFNTVAFPEKVKWNFGDPASGFYNTAGSKYPTHLYTAPGNYFLTLTVFNAGDSVTILDTISIVTPVEYNFGPDIYLCNSGDTTLTAPQVAGAVYEWNNDSLTKTDFVKISKTGVYTVKINGCAVTDSIGVFYSDTPTFDLGKNHILCAGEILTLNAASQNGVYRWSLNGAALPDTVAQLPVTAPGGKYVVVVSIPGCGTYSDSAVITYNALPAPPFSLGPDTLLCPKQIYTIKASVAGATSYDWNTGATQSSIQVSDAGWYWAFVTINKTCQVVDTVQVKYRGDKKLDFRDTAICTGSTLVLDADFGTGVYHWQAIPTPREDQDSTNQSTYYVYKPGMYSVVASVGNCVYKDSLTVSWNDSLKVKMAGDTSLCVSEHYVFQVNGNANSYLWQDRSTADSYTVNGAGTYSVIAKNGCGIDTLNSVVTLRKCDCDLTLPNAFTPNGNGTNETFRPLHPCKMTDFSLRVFNRWGQTVFVSDNQEKAWDGTFNGTKIGTGTYIWQASYTNTDTKQHHIKKGVVMLMR